MDRMERERLFDIAAPYVERLAGDAEDKVEAEIVEVRGEDTQSAATRGSVVAAPHGFEERVGKGLDAEAEPIDAGVAPFAAAGVGDIVGVGLKGEFRRPVPMPGEQIPGGFGDTPDKSRREYGGCASSYI